MNYYIDFDHTLFDTPKLTERMLKTISESSKNDIIEECREMFNREHIYNIYELAKYFSEKYNLNEKSILRKLDDIIYNCDDLVFPDSIPFLKKLKNRGHKIYMLSYYEYELQYQYAKIAGSHLADYFDAIFVTKDLKYELDINYTNGIFIDDKPKDIIGLYSKNPYKVIRLRRNNHKYAEKNIENINIEEYENFNQIPIE